MPDKTWFIMVYFLLNFFPVSESFKKNKIITLKIAPNTVI